MSRYKKIYDSHADKYNELVNAEDYQNNLPRALNRLATWSGAIVFEAGAGTGRVTSFYIESCRHATCCDLSSHMLNNASERLAAFSSKIGFCVADNLALPVIENKCDIFIEGWSFGHSVMESCVDISLITDKLFANATRSLKPDGLLIFIETLGTNTTIPQAPAAELGTFYDLLENKFAFKSETIQTNYQFSSAEAAAESMGFFFGDQMGLEVLQQNKAIIPEWTGIWHRKLKLDDS